MELYSRMKICPKCQSSYSDETLNFCLTDGVPLVVEEALPEHLSSREWHDAETLIDSRELKSDSPHRTASGGSSPTFVHSPAHTSSFQAQKTSNPYPVIGAILILALIGGIWWFSRASNQNVPAIIAENTAATPKRVAVQLSAEQENSVKREVADFLNSWRETNEKKDIDAHIAHYVDNLQIYYGESGIDKNHVRADRLRAYQRYDTISVEVDKLKITAEAEDAATAVFDKTWTMKNAKKTSTGSVEQEIHVSKIKGKWLIDSEKDVKVYYINNRENETNISEK
jgi:hypothetical protein